MDNKSNPLDGLVYRLVDDIEGNSFRLENNKGESLQLNLPDGLQFGEQITIPKAIKANERKHMKINTSRHKNEDNLSQDDLEANSRLVSSALSKLLQAYDAMSDLYYSNIIVRAKHGDEEYTTHDIAENEIVTPRTAYGHIQKLVKNGLLTQTSMKGDVVYKVNWKGMYKFCGATFIFEEGEDR